MTLQQFLETILTSNPYSDWVTNDLEGSHPNAAVYKNNISITMQWGQRTNPDRYFQETWATKFPDPLATMHTLDLFYNGVLVYREYYAAVDGGRHYLPLPQAGTTDVEQTKMELIHFLNCLAGKHNFKEALKRAGLNVLPEYVLPFHIE